ncbi:MAG: GNAT family N-acetyltransferase [Marinobacter sp.]|uniref:GNAT family N-acetyltransferase n=1 Tax=Marinobacter sp. TaxID=50741 RepID=UPI00299E181A|nr:GNAT family N-acetyltransferase [Marinobacter sp.]MDX1756600.1 GNAT family N-acetyltransferase [Marinobacter sp.]
MAGIEHETMEIRSYRAAELHELIKLFEASVSELTQAYYTEPQRRAWLSSVDNTGLWQQRLSAGETLVAENSGFLMGFISFTDQGHIDLLFTHPQCARLGVATRLYQQAERRLFSRGVRRLHTEASRVARSFFTAMGFGVTETEVVEQKGVLLERFRMEKFFREKEEGSCNSLGPILNSS